MRNVCESPFMKKCPKHVDDRCCKSCEEKKTCIYSLHSCKCEDKKCEYMKQEEDS